MLKKTSENLRVSFGHARNKTGSGAEPQENFCDFESGKSSISPNCRPFFIALFRINSELFLVYV